MSRQKSLEFYEKRHRIQIKKNEDFLSIKIPKFIEIASNWAKRTTEVPTEVPLAIEEKKKRRRKRRKRIRAKEGEKKGNYKQE